MNNVLTVSQLNRYVKSVLDGDFRLQDVLLKGEISNFVNHYRSGHFYFTLKEGGCAVKAVMFASYAKSLLFEPEDGMAVILRCSVSLYERDGSYQLYVYEMQPDGKGSLQIAFEQLYRKLESKGLFAQENKRLIPRFPKRIGVVTSETGAALQDILNILSRRYPIATVVLAPALVQGSEAPASLNASLRQLDEFGDCDVIIIGRGGGSMEDLWCFNDEQLVMQVAACSTPVISAVGHETDFTLCDYAADLRAPTPSAAAELASANINELLQGLDDMTARIDTAVRMNFQKKEQRFAAVCTKSCFAEPKRLVDNYTKKLEYFEKSIQFHVKNAIIRKQEALTLQKARLEALNPIARLKNGYSIAMKDGHSVSSVKEVSVGDKLAIRLQDGTVYAEVAGIEESNLL